MKAINVYLITITLLFCGLNLLAFIAEAPLKKSSKKVRKYSLMSEEAKRDFISQKAEKFLDRFGQTPRDEIPAEGITSIKNFVDGYITRTRKKRTNICSQQNWLKSDLVSILQRGKQTAPMIAKAYEEQGLEPIIGLYVAMVESEFCPCLQSPTGPLGMFQMTRSWGEKNGLDTKKGASPNNPDERCSPEKASQASATSFKYIFNYFQKRIGDEYRPDGVGIPLAISAYNSGRGGLRKNLETVKNIIPADRRVTFWDLAANKEKLSSQFQYENYRYFPKFMATLIIGENPEVFGIPRIKPLSKYVGETE